MLYILKLVYTTEIQKNGVLHILKLVCYYINK